MAVKPIPEGYSSITPYLILDGAARALEFYQKTFGATEIMRFEMPNGKLGHAEMRIGNAIIMLADEVPEMKYLGPQRLGGSPVTLLLYVENVDDVFHRALAAGATEVKPLRNQFYGDRSGTVADPFGHVWTIATHVEDVTSEEMERRMAALHQQAT